MITNFEHLTQNISKEDIKNVKPLLQILDQTSKDNQVLTPSIVYMMNLYAKDQERPTITGRKLRKLVNYIRSNGIAAIMATSKGYYISVDEKDIADQIKSLTERANSIFDCVEGLNRILKAIKQ